MSRGLPGGLLEGHLESAARYAHACARVRPGLADEFEGACMAALVDAAGRFDPAADGPFPGLPPRPPPGRPPRRRAGRRRAPGAPDGGETRPGAGPGS
jgi:hypothetical protein